MKHCLLSFLLCAGIHYHYLSKCIARQIRHRSCLHEGSSIYRLHQIFEVMKDYRSMPANSYLLLLQRVFAYTIAHRGTTDAVMQWFPSWSQGNFVWMCLC